EHGPQPVHLVDEQDVARAERGEQADQVARALEHRARYRADFDAQLLRHEEGEGRLAEAGWPEEQRMVQRLASLLRRVDRDLERFLHLRLADEFVQSRRAEGGGGEPLLGERVGGGNLGTGGGGHRFPTLKSRFGETQRRSVVCFSTVPCRAQASAWEPTQAFTPPFLSPAAAPATAPGARPARARGGYGN